MDICPNDYSLKQLRDWLLQLNQPTSGTKAMLAIRLNAISKDERGSCPTVVPDGGVDEADFGEVSADEVDADEVVANEVEDDNLLGACSEDLQNKLENIQKELEIIKRERELLAKENALLKRLTAVSVAKNSVVEENIISSFNMLKEFIAEYDGSTNVSVWTAQLKCLGNVHKVDGNTLRALFVTKLRAKAQKWLYSMPNYVTLDAEQLMHQLEEMFATKESQLCLRRKLEERKWQYDESFSAYCNDKEVLANAVHMDESEMVDYIIDGIPDPYFRTQAHIMCLSTKSQLIRAFSKIVLKKPQKLVQRVTSDSSNAQNKNRCFNCNSSGHSAVDCKKPKREPGSCYGCGSLQHRVAECPQRKMPVMTLEADPEEIDYVRLFKIYLVGNKNVFLSVDCLVDSGSPISFIKQQCIGHLNIKYEKLSNNELCYVGLNKTKLICFGKIPCFVNFDGKNILFTLMVVANESTSYHAVLGSDFMKKCRIKIVFENEINCKCTKMIREKDIAIQNHEVLKVNCAKIQNEKETQEINVKKNYENYETKLCEMNETTNEIMSIDYEMFSENECINIADNIDESIKSEFFKIFDKYYVSPSRPEEPRITCEMKLTLLSPKPFHCSPRRLSFFEKNELQKLLDEYLEKGYIKPSSSEYASPIVLVKKKSQNLRMCVDFRTLNKMTAKDNYPLPIIDDLLDKLGNKCVFSKLDLKNGFFHVFMNKDSKKYTSFVTPFGQFEWERMPFGLRNAPSVFQRYVNSIFSNMIRHGKVIIYMDDILIATTNIKEHLEILKEIFEKCVENKLELKIKKCEFLQDKIRYLGYNISKEGISANEKSLEAIKRFPIPANTQTVQSFLGLSSYFRRFVENFSLIAKPLYDLTKKDRPFSFGEVELESFEKLKGKLVSSPILAIYDPNDYTELHCDASSIGFGAILFQRKKDGKMHPIFYFSKRTTETESKYHSFELETLAIIYALQRFRIYLHGKHFKIVTDCNSLTLTLNKKELNPRIARWALELQNYDYVLEHRSAKRMQHVDALSRATNILVLETNTFEENLIICQGKDEDLCKLKKELETSEHKLYELRNGILYRKTDKNTVLFYVPKAMENHILHKYHNDMAHSGVNKTIELIKNGYWFPQMSEKVKRHIRNCLKCIAYSNKNGKEEGFLHNIPKETAPFEVIHVDHYGPIENSDRSKKHIFLVVDAYTKFVKLYPTKTTKTKEVIVALQNYFRSYSRPKKLISDRGSCYTSSDFEEFLLSNNVQHIKVATGSPQANGQVERVNRSLGPMLSKLTEPDKGLHWDKIIETVEYALNNTIHRTIGDHPSVMLFGVKQRGNVIDILKENYLEQQNNNKINLKEIRSNAQEKQNKLQEYNANYVNKNRKEPRKYIVGDLVMVKNFNSQGGGPKKLIPKFKGPYKIAKVLRNDRYVLEDADNFQQSQIPYKGV